MTDCNQPEHIRKHNSFRLDFSYLLYTYKLLKLLHINPKPNIHWGNKQITHNSHKLMGKLGLSVLEPDTLLYLTGYLFEFIISENS